MDNLTLRRARADDAAAISQLIHDLAHCCTIDPDSAGADEFFQNVSPSAIERYVTAPDFYYQVAYDGVDLAGIVAVREGKHLYHLFVASRFQRKGIGASLWSLAKAAAIAGGNRDGFTVNSSANAVPMYARFGFVATGPMVEHNGVAFVPMRLRDEGRMKQLS